MSSTEGWKGMCTPSIPRQSEYRTVRLSPGEDIRMPRRRRGGLDQKRIAPPADVGGASLLWAVGRQQA
jgi:hypothetical protein